MVVFYLRNSKIPDGKIVPVTVSLNLDVVKGQLSIPTVSGFPTKVDPEGEQIWLLTLATTEVDLSGVLIAPEFINIISKDTVHDEIEAALGRIGEQVNWGTVLPDIRPPRVIELTPDINQTTDVKIGSDIIVRLQDALPAAGIDLTTVKMIVNDIDVTDDLEIKGNPFDLTLIFRPVRITL